MLDRILVGQVPKKPHIAFADANGALRFEECLTRQGFDGPYTMLYHTHKPHTARGIQIEPALRIPLATSQRPLLRRHYQTLDMKSQTNGTLARRMPLLFNDDVTLSVAQPQGEDAFYFSNGDADELVFIHQGAGVLRTLLGDLRYEPHDYLFIPRGTLHRWIPDPALEQHWFWMEFTGNLGIPGQFRNETGQLRMDAPYSHRDFRRPEFYGPQDEGLRVVIVKRQDAFHAFEYAHSPLDVVGWDGFVYPIAFPMLNFQPRVSSIHLPPTWHGTFAAKGALVCSFVPRPLDFHPEAIPCPYPHSSVHIDEVIFYSKGEFTSRKGVGPASVSHHPAGIPHGPHPGAYEKSIGLKETNELAVMLDCSKPLHATAEALTVEDIHYHDSFA